MDILNLDFFAIHTYVSSRKGSDCAFVLETVKVIAVKVSRLMDRITHIVHRTDAVDTDIDLASFQQSIMDHRLVDQVIVYFVAFDE